MQRMASVVASCSVCVLALMCVCVVCMCDMCICVYVCVA